jgi:hypothetical protein
MVRPRCPVGSSHLASSLWLLHFHAHRDLRYCVRDRLWGIPGSPNSSSVVRSAGIHRRFIQPLCADSSRSAYVVLLGPWRRRRVRCSLNFRPLEQHHLTLAPRLDAQDRARYERGLGSMASRKIFLDSGLCTKPRCASEAIARRGKSLQGNLADIAIYCNEVKGKSALALSHAPPVDDAYGRVSRVFELPRAGHRRGVCSRAEGLPQPRARAGSV